jgi:hypothetical protein
MNERPGRWLVLPWVFALVLSAVVGFAAYQAGLAHAVAVAAPGGAAAVPVPQLYWFHPFGFIFPLFLLFFVFGAFRLLVWGGPWRWRHGGYSGVPPAFDEWHRRAHHQMGGTNNPPPGP